MLIHNLKEIIKKQKEKDEERLQKERQERMNKK